MGRNRFSQISPQKSCISRNQLWSVCLLARSNLWAKNEQNRFFDLCRRLVHSYGHWLLNTSEFYYLAELYGNELVFVLSFVSSNNSDVETAEQFILLYTRYVCDFSSPNFGNSKTKFISYFVFFATCRFSCF